MRTIRLAFPAYDGVRYSQPSVGRVLDWPAGRAHPILEFGGHTRPIDSPRGAAGHLTVSARSLELIRVGQYDREADYYNSWWYVVNEDDAVTLITEAMARILWDAGTIERPAPVDSMTTVHHT